MMEQWYRYHDENYTSGPAVCLTAYNVAKHTEKGVWLDVFGDKKFVLSDPRGKRFAYALKEDALKSFIARKKRQARIYAARLQSAKDAEQLAKWMLEHDNLLEPWEKFRNSDVPFNMAPLT
jgi:hypothetical protein